MTKAAKAKAPEKEDEGLIAMTKGGETIHVHPSCVADHERAGWTVEG